MKKSAFNYPVIITCGILSVLASKSIAQDMQQQASEVIQEWPEVAKEAAQKIIDQYGDPHHQTTDILIWNNNGDWGKTIVQREEIDHQFPMPHKDVLYQEINYQVPPR